MIVCVCPPSLNKNASSGKIRKFTVRYDVQIAADDNFQVARRIIGIKGIHMKQIFTRTYAKLRLRGRGSGYLEGLNRQEADEPLQLCISSCDENMYRIACEMATNLLRGVYDAYDEWLIKQSKKPKHLQIKLKEVYIPTRSTSVNNCCVNGSEKSMGASADLCECSQCGDTSSRHTHTPRGNADTNTNSLPHTLTHTPQAQVLNRRALNTHKHTHTGNTHTIDTHRHAYTHTHSMISIGQPPTAQPPHAHKQANTHGQLHTPNRTHTFAHKPTCPPVPLPPQTSPPNVRRHGDKSRQPVNSSLLSGVDSCMMNIPPCGIMSDRSNHVNRPPPDRFYNQIFAHI